MNNMNLLKSEKSPYLRQHKDNPVHWMPWGEDALTRARSENKPILLSIGYAACHWCHVMAHESFEDQVTADIMNAHFVNIKVDREERPDIDGIYQQALAIMGQQGGWPLTLFLTPDAKPFWGGTYFPPHAQHGLPAFKDVLQGIANSFPTEQEKITHNTNTILKALTHLQTAPQGSGLKTIDIEQASNFFLSNIDMIYGGFGEAPKFPQFNILSFLWSQYVITGKDAFKSSVIHSLTQMCQGGIYDHIAGGLCRYSVDQEFLVPHFEKMLYDNALFLSSLCDVYQETSNPLFLNHMTQTLDFLIDDLLMDEKDVCGFATSRDADSLNDIGEKQEGAFYIWTSSEIDDALGADAEEFKQIYDITAFGNWQEGNTAHKPSINIPNRLKQPGRLNETVEKKMTACLKKLKDVRDARPAPARDDKILADMNGLMISSLCQISHVLENKEYIDIAARVFDFIVTHMMADDGTLSHSYCDGVKTPHAFLDDYAFLSKAAIDLHQATQDDKYIDHVQKWIDVLRENFWDIESGGFFQTSKHQTDVILRKKDGEDGAIINGNAVMAHVLTCASFLNIKTDVAPHDIFKAFSYHLKDFIFGRAHLLQRTTTALHPMHITLTGSDISPFLDVLRHLYLPDLCFVHIDNKNTEKSDVSAVICIGTVCLSPITDVDIFRKTLLKERAHHNHLAANDQ